MNNVNSNSHASTLAVHPDWAGSSLHPRPMFLHQSVDCPHCGAWYSEACIRPSDKPASFMDRRSVPSEKRKAIESHKKRTQLIDQKLATSKFVIQLSDAQQNFAQGDLFMASSNGDGTFALHFRIEDGAPAGFTASRHEAEFICWEENLITL